MKNKLFLFISFILAISTVHADDLQFKKSAEEELDEATKYYQRPNESLEDVKKKFLSRSIKLYHPDKLFYISDLIKDCEVNQKTKQFMFWSDFQKTFEYLKQIMGIPAEVNFMYCDDQSLGRQAAMSYSYSERTLFIFPLGLYCGPSYRLFQLIHELTHVQQHMHMGMLEFHLAVKRPLDKFKQEHEAEINAAVTIKCPLCMKAVVAFQALQDKTATPEVIKAAQEKGYLISEDLKKYLQQKSLNDLCMIHKLIENPDIESGLDTIEDCKQLYNEDCGQMFDRLS